MGKRPMRICRLAFAVPVEPNADGLNADAPLDDGGGVKWRDVKCYETDDVNLVVHRNHVDRRVYNLSHAPTGKLIPTAATRSPEPLIELANSLSRMTDWAQVNAAAGINELPPRIRKRITAEIAQFNRSVQFGPAARKATSKKSRVRGD